MIQWLKVTEEIFLFSKTNTGFGVLRELSPGVKQPVYEADHSPPPNAEAKNTCHYTSSPSIHFSGMHRNRSFR
jgi:hypothetical protein